MSNESYLFITYYCNQREKTFYAENFLAKHEKLQFVLKDPHTVKPAEYEPS